jgi:hypothetical protein
VVVEQRVGGAAPEGGGPEADPRRPPVGVAVEDLDLLDVRSPDRVALDVERHLEAPPRGGAHDHPLRRLLLHLALLPYRRIGLFRRTTP